MPTKQKKQTGKEAGKKAEKQIEESLERELFVKSLTLSENFRNLKKGYKIKFDSPITLLVGENGSGKSTVLDLIRSYYDTETISFLKSNLGKKIRIYGSKLKKEDVFYFDFHSDDMKYSGHFGADMGAQLSAMWASSGEGLVMQFLSTGVVKKQKSLILLDELGRGGSIRTQYIHSAFLANLAVKNKNQVIASTHLLPVLELSKQSYCSLYSMEHKKYLEFEDFIQSQKDLKKSPFLH